jgi:hypothetical protein
MVFGEGDGRDEAEVGVWADVLSFSSTSSQHPALALGPRPVLFWAFPQNDSNLTSSLLVLVSADRVLLSREEKESGGGKAGWRWS